MEQLQTLEKGLGYVFKDKLIAQEALTHRSFKQSYHNERLEFLGDAVLDLIIGEYLYHKFNGSDEGMLSKIRASLVNENAFAQLAIKLDVGKYILLSIAEENNGGRAKPSLLSNAFEALIGAVYLDGGLEISRSVVIKMLEEFYPTIDLQTLSKDYKTALQEITQATHGVPPEYIVVRAFGPDHKKEFEVELRLHDALIASAIGNSKKEAQQKAAKIALDALNKGN